MGISGTSGTRSPAGGGGGARGAAEGAIEATGFTAGVAPDLPGSAWAAGLCRDPEG